MAAASEINWRRQALGRRVGTLALVLLVGFLFIWPVAMLFIGIFRNAPPGLPGEWTLDPLVRTFASYDTYKALGNSVIYAVSTTALATLLGAAFAFLATRTTVRLRQCITPVMLLVFAAPNLFYAISWALLADPSTGLLNAAARFVTQSQVNPFNGYSWAGLIIVQSLKLTGFCYLLLLGPFEAMNRSFEEASLIAGAGRLKTVLLIDIPLMTPAIFGVVIVGTVFGLGAFDIPQILGGLAGISVLSTEIFRAVNFSVPPDYARASALGLFMVFALALLLVIQWRVVKAGRFVTMTGKAYKQDRWDLGGWSSVGTAAIVIFTIVALLLPITQLVLTSFQPAIGVYKLTLKNFQAVLADRQTVRAFQVTLELAVLSGLLAMLLATWFGHVGRRSPRWLERYLDTATLVPIVLPGVVLAVGLLWAYVSTPGLRELYGTFWLALIGLVVAIMPIASRAVRGALAQIAKDLEEAAAVAGASSMRVLFDIVVRLMSRSFASGWLVTAVIAAGALDVPLMLLSPTQPSVAILVYSHLISGIPTEAATLLVLLLLAIIAIALLFAAVNALVGIARRRPVDHTAPARRTDTQPAGAMVRPQLEKPV